MKKNIKFTEVEGSKNKHIFSLPGRRKTYYQKNAVMDVTNSMQYTYKKNNWAHRKQFLHSLPITPCLHRRRRLSGVVTVGDPPNPNIS